MLQDKKQAATDLAQQGINNPSSYAALIFEFNGYLARHDSSNCYFLLFTVCGMCDGAFVLTKLICVIAKFHGTLGIF